MPIPPDDQTRAGVALWAARAKGLKKIREQELRALTEAAAGRLCDLFVHKASASRDRDWVDIEGVLLRQGAAFDTTLIREELAPLVDLKEESAILTRLETMFRRARLS